MNKKTSISAPGKLILLGEYAVLQGAPALVTAVNRNAKVIIKPSETPGGRTGQNDFSVASPTLDILPQPFMIGADGKIIFPKSTANIRKHLRFFAAGVETFLHISGKALPSCEIELNTDEFYLTPGEKLGFGSSAALTVALLDALYEFTGASPDNRNQLFRHAVQTHFQAQGKMGSGIDIAASVFGGTLQYQITPGDPLNAIIEEIEMPKHLLMLVVWAGESASTRQLVGLVNTFAQQHPHEFKNLMARMSELSFEGCHAIVNQEIVQFLDIVDQYYLAMDELGQRSNAPIISAEHAKIAKIAKQNGAFYKPSGAGGGDMGIAFAASINILETVADALTAAGFQLIGVNIAQDGVGRRKEEG